VIGQLCAAADQGRTLGFGMIEGFGKVIEGQQSSVAEGYGFYTCQHCQHQWSAGQCDGRFVWRTSLEKFDRRKASITFDITNVLAG
jgi:hypothetical protein